MISDRACSNLLLIHTAGQKTAINGQDGAGYETASIGCEKDRCTYQFLQLTKALHGRTDQDFLASRLPDYNLFR
jgi:hypothetical protein